MRIGPISLRNPVVLAPMAGTTDRPFRELVWELGAGLVVAEMTSARPDLWDTATSQRRRLRSNASGPFVLQIAGGDAAIVADGARRAEAAGAEIVDVNMGCPAKKVCNKAAGSALLRDERLVAEILEAAVRAVSVPVTVKIRTGWCPESRNGVAIARIAEAAGIAAISVHGRTRACRFHGVVEHATVTAIKRAVRIPVLANGDIDSPEAALHVMQSTGVDGVLIGRAALGRPWLPADIAHYFATGHPVPGRSRATTFLLIRRHLDAMHEFYGEPHAIGIARKHVKAYLQHLGVDPTQIHAFNDALTGAQQHAVIEQLQREEDESMDWMGSEQRTAA
jgi:tRNA-dihydrouridine synthase B